MSEKEDLIVKEIGEVLSKVNLFKILSITNINHKPHQFMVGPKHVVHAADHHGGMLGDATLKVVPCAYPKCNLMYDDHTSDKVAFLQLLRSGKSEEANEELMKIKQLLTDNTIDGIVMVEDEGGFTIT